MAQDGGASFARDFGYLMPFLQKVEQAAQQSGNAELQKLVAGQRETWGRIQALLSGAAPGASAPAASAGTRRPAAASNGAAVPRALTVGTLRRG